MRPSSQPLQSRKPVLHSIRLRFSNRTSPRATRAFSVRPAPSCAPARRRPSVSSCRTFDWPTLDKRLDDADGGGAYASRGSSSCVTLQIASLRTGLNTLSAHHGCWTRSNLAMWTSRSRTWPAATCSGQALILAHALSCSVRCGARWLKWPAEARCAALRAIIELARGVAELRVAGIENTFEASCRVWWGYRWGRKGGLDREARERARRALEAMEHVVVATENT
jgi:hypothetical protein